MARYAMSIDLTTCVGCDACVVACKLENEVPDGYARDWTEEYVTEEGERSKGDSPAEEGRMPHLQMEIYSNRCQHCENPPCVMVCPTEASYVEKGIVLIDREKCVECRHCIAGCPYGARFHVPGRFVDKCTFCSHRLGSGRSTACVEVCPTGSLEFGDLEDPNSAISRLLQKREYKVLQPARHTKPKYFLLLSSIERKELSYTSEGGTADFRSIS